MPTSIIFTSRDNALRLASDKKNCNKIYISPEKTSWNDFSYKISGSLRFNIDGIHYIFEALVAVINEENQFRGIGDIPSLEKEIPLFLNEAPPQSYFILLPSMDIYRNFIARLGIEKSIEILTALNDVVSIKFNNKRDTWLHLIESSPVFQLAFMRNTDSFFTYHNAKDLLKGLEFEELEYISKKLQLKFQLDGFHNPHLINLVFNSTDLIPKRINIFIGENGLGKSQALKQFTQAFIRPDQSENLKDIGPNDELRRPMVNRILAIATPGETINTFPPEKNNPSKIFYKKLNLTRNSNAIGFSLMKLIRDNRRIGEHTRLEIFQRCLKNVLPIEKIVFKPKHCSDIIHLSDLLNNYSREQTLLELSFTIRNSTDPKIKSKDNITLYSMSSGQLSFFKFALLSCLHIENGSFVLLDEPETHLHPSLISEFVTLLDNLLELTGSYAIIATHSPYFVREVSREQVHVFKKNNEDYIEILQPRLKTFGSNIGDISYFVFDENTTNTLSQKIIHKAKDKGYSYQYIIDNFKNELPSELLYQLKRELL